MRAARIVTAVVSALVLLVTGYGWTAYRELGARLPGTRCPGSCSTRSPPGPTRAR